MGIDAAGTQFLFAARAAGVDFTDTATLGRQFFCPTESGLKPIAKALKIPGGASGLIATCAGSGDRFIEMLGARSVTSFDASDYEGASIVHDMNDPLPEEYRGKFSAVIDGGTIEHVFNITQSLKNCLEMVKPGGHFLSIQVGNNFLGHGFYQLSPEFFFRTLTVANGYELISASRRRYLPVSKLDIYNISITKTINLRLICNSEIYGKPLPPTCISVMLCTREPLRFYGVRDPQASNLRVALINYQQTYVLAIARRISDKHVFSYHPQQGYYAAIWANSTTNLHVQQPHGQPSHHARLLFDRIKAMVPGRAKSAIKGLLGWRGFGQPCFYRLTLEDMVRGSVSEPTRQK